MLTTFAASPLLSFGGPCWPMAVPIPIPATRVNSQAPKRRERLWRHERPPLESWDVGAMTSMPGAPSSLEGARQRVKAAFIAILALAAQVEIDHLIGAQQERLRDREP